MSKIIQIIQIQKSLSIFSDKEIIQAIKEFNKTPLGKIYLAVPWTKLIKLIKKKPSTKGKKPLFSLKGELALMILKAYSNLSDKKLAEQINSNIQYQRFCDLPIKLIPQIKDYKIISRIRVKLSKVIDWDKFQEIHIKYWQEYISNKGHILIDATCYETDMRYPTDVKLLYESLEYIYKKINKIIKSEGIKRPRSKYKEIKAEYICYSRQRKKSYKKTRKMLKKLLYLNEKALTHLEELQKKYVIKCKLKQETVSQVIEQQRKKWQGEKIENVILSLHKPYIRPIVRGKETKRVEFGSKVNKIQVDGINIIEKISYGNFNEGTRYESSIKKSESLLETEVTLTGADRIYGTNKNRQYAKLRGIQTDFIRKGRAGKNEKARKLLSGLIRKARGSRLEGSFGVEKRIYGLEKIKGRTAQTEVLYIYLGIYTKNMLEIGRRMYNSMKAGPFLEKPQKVP